MNTVVTDPQLAGPAKSQTLGRRVWEDPNLKVVIWPIVGGLKPQAKKP
jgi:hypothetical protein